MTLTQPTAIGDIAHAIWERAREKHPELINRPPQPVAERPASDGDDPGDPDCEMCKGYGLIRLDVPIDHPQFGKLLVCPACRPNYAQEVARRAYERNVATIDKYAIIPRKNATFETFDTAGRTASIHAAKLAAQKYIAPARENPWLVLYGDVGTGKTHLAMAITNALRARREPVLFASAPNLLDLLRPGDKPTASEELIEIAKNVPYLIIDDLGTQKDTAWVFEKLYQIINHRYNLLTPLILTLNAPPQELPARLRSRVLDIQTTIIHMEDVDFRLKRRRER